MKIPNVKGKNKIRDAMICRLYVEGYSPDEIKEYRSLPISVRRIDQILYNNKEFVKIDKDWEETKQVNRIKRKIRKSDDSKKDVYDWEKLLSEKITPQRVEHSGQIGGGETKIIIIRPTEKEVDGRLRAECSEVETPAISG